MPKKHLNFKGIHTPSINIVWCGKENINYIIIKNMSVTYVCECCGEPITREEYDSQRVIAYCQTCKKLSPKKRIQRAQKVWEARQALKAQSKNNVK
jgi:hypothetical protein